MEQGQTKKINVEVSPKNKFVTQDRTAILWNVLKFTAPALAVFFGQLAAGVELKIAVSVAALALYGLLQDLFSKWKEVKYY